MKKESALFAFAFALIFFSAFASASVLYSNLSTNIQTKYTGGEYVKGDINLSFKNEPAKSILTSSFNGSISVIDFLRANGLDENDGFKCSIIGCDKSYKATDSTSSITLAENENKFVGFKVTGSEVEITKLEFSVQSTAQASCSQAVILDLFVNNTYLIQNFKYLNETCGNRLNGCFSSSAGEFETATIPGSPSDEAAYCEKMELPIAPAFNVGGNITNGTKRGTLIMDLYKANGEYWDPVGKCNLPALSAAVQEVKCIIEYPNIEKGDYYLCIHANSADSNFQIRAEVSGNICGYSGAGSTEVERDFELFVEPLKFDSANIVLNTTSFEKIYPGIGGVAALADEYIDNKYARNCSASAGGCVIPFKFSSSLSQILSLSNIAISYMPDRNKVTTLSGSSLYLLEEIQPVINSDYKVLDIEKANFMIPVSSKQKTLQFYIDNPNDNLDSKAILPKELKINVTPGFTFDIFPKFAYLGIDTSFSISTSYNITNSEWDFGDNSVGISENKNIKHKYTQSGQYNVSVEVTRKDGVKAVGRFSIAVGEPKATTELLIKNYDSAIGNLSSKIGTLDSWIKTNIESTLNLSYIKSELKDIKDKVDDSDANYTELLTRLTELEVPSAVSVSGTGILPIEIGYDRIDVQYAQEIYVPEESLSEEQKDYIKNKIILWNEEHYTANVEVKDYLLVLENSESEDLFSHYKFVVSSKNQTDENVNLIIPYPLSDLKFKDNYAAKEIVTESGSATAIPISGATTIEVLIPGKASILELGAYFTPDIKDFVNIEPIEPVDDENPRKELGKWLFIILIVAVFIVYIILQEWYKRRYESHLFPDKNDLFNLVNFIYNSRTAKMSDEQIRSKLLQMKWKGEQLNYAFRKLDGKRTGMWEIPIFKWVENRRVKKEIEKRKEQTQQNLQDARFFNRPY